MAHNHQDHHQNHRGSDGSALPHVVVVMVPLPAQGHLNQLLQLSRLVAAHNIPVHYLCTAAHNHQAKLRIHGWDARAAASDIQFHDLLIPEFKSPIPDPNATNKFPSHLQPLFDSLAHLRLPVAELLHSLSRTAHRVVVIHDSMMSSVVQDVASTPNAESYVFHSVSAFAIFLYFWEGLKQTPFPVDEGLQKLIPSLEDCFSPEFMAFIISEMGYVGLSSGSLYNSCRSVEGEYLDSIEKLLGNESKNQWAMGPFNPVEIREKKPDETRHECLKWLDKQEPGSVIFVSFGTTTTLSNEQIKELADGLEESEIKFIWVVRDADRGINLEARDPLWELPEGFEERVRERGIVVREWAPQLEILAHTATAGFLSHCGWNSCMESISMGVPMAAWPMHSDQPRNTVLITQVLKIGLVVKDWARRNETVVSSTISGVLKTLMGSEEIRRRADDLAAAVRTAVADGGVTRLEMDSFIAHIKR